MFASANALSMIKRLTWTDVVNAGTWIILGALIEFEIFLRVTRRAAPNLLRLLHRLQSPFWAVLVIDVFYWWALGEPLDAWYASPEYQPLIALRQSAVDMDRETLFALDGA